MKNRQLTFAGIFLCVALAVSVAYSQEQPASGNGDQPASSPAVQPADSTAPSKETAPAAQPAERPAASQETKTASPTAAPKAPGAKPAASADKAVKKEQPAPAKEAANPPAGTGLLDVSDDEYKAARIPGMPAMKKADVSQNIEVEETGDGESVEAETTKDSKGFLGMSKETVDTLMIVIFFVLIGVIFILYRARSRGGSRRVTRSYMKR